MRAALSYETWDAIADAYLPFLVVVAAALALQPALQHRWRCAFTRLSILCALVGIAYGLMLLDASAQLWKRLGLDYSTHTAVTISMASFLRAYAPKRAAVIAASALLYFALMLYQRYHSATDIVTTAVAVGALCILALRRAHASEDAI
jgi:hypothetical protein